MNITKNMSTKTNFQKVLDFNTCFNHKVSNEPFLNVFTEEPKLVKLRLSLIEEEIKELQEAYQNNDIVEIVDALSDILYVAYGLCVCFGIDIDRKYTEYIRLYLEEDKSNSQTLEENNNLTNFQKTQLIIPLTNDVRKYSTLLESSFFKTNLNTINKYLMDNFKNLQNACEQNNFDDVIMNVYNVIKYTYLFGIHIGCDLDASFTIVHDSNMTKICETEELAKETVQNYKDNDDRYDSPSYKQNEFGYVIFNESTGKILKSMKYTPANFDSLLN